MIYTVTFNPAIDYVVGIASSDLSKKGLQLGAINRTAYECLNSGGKGINVSWMLQNLGVKSVALGFVAGFTGREIVRGVQAHGIEAGFIELESGMSRINVKVKSGDDKGDDTEINGQGPEISPQALESLFQQLDALLKDEDVLVLAGSIPSSLPDNVYELIMERFSANPNRHVNVVVDATKDLLKKVLKYKPFLVKPNTDELADLFQLPKGKTIQTDQEVTHYARELQKLGAQHVLVSMAGEGSLLLDASGKHVLRMGVPRGTDKTTGAALQLKSSVGAGDSMVAGFLSGYFQKGGSKNKTEEEEKAALRSALLLGTAAGSATAFSVGLGTRELIDELLEELKA